MRISLLFITIMCVGLALPAHAADKYENLSKSEIEEYSDHYIEEIAMLHAKLVLVEDEETRDEIQRQLYRMEKKAVGIKEDLAESTVGNTDELEKAEKKLSYLDRKTDVVDGDIDSYIYSAERSSTTVASIVDMIIFSVLIQTVAVSWEETANSSSEITKTLDNKSKKGINATLGHSITTEVLKLLNQSSQSMHEAEELNENGEELDAIYAGFSALQQVKTAEDLMERIDIQEFETLEQDEYASFYYVELFRMNSTLGQLAETRVELLLSDDTQNTSSKLKKAATIIKRSYKKLSNLGPNGDIERFFSISEKLDIASNKISNASDSSGEGSDEHSEEIIAAAAQQIVKATTKYETLTLKFNSKKKKLPKKKRKTVRAIHEYALIYLNYAKAHVGFNNYSQAAICAHISLMLSRSGLYILSFN